MISSRLLATGLVGFLVWLQPAAAGAGEVILDSSGFISGSQSLVDSFSLPTAGTLTVTLSDIQWPDAIQGLNGFVSSANQVLVPDFGPGTESVSVGPGTVWVHWSGTGAGPLAIGAYGMEIQFQPAVVPVPLPGTLGLLGSGLLLATLLSRPRRRARSARGHS